MHTTVVRRAAGALVAALALVPCLLVVQAHAAGSTTVFINEIHYDNTGTDAGEFVEVAGPSGTNLSGWSLVLYNGSGGAAYGTRALSGTIADQGGGYGTVAVSYPSNGIQNGSPDGVALVDAGGTVVQFLSYEGVFAGVGGPANGRTSVDMGVSEAGTEPVGQSLQLSGTGLAYEEFRWTGPAPATPGQPNPGQTFAPGNSDPEPEADLCATPVTHTIPEVQGAGFSSGLVGSQVTVEGVVVGDFQAGTQLGGVFVQDPAGDGNLATSDGIFVDTPDPLALVQGDVVRVTGTVQEVFGLTQLGSVTGADCGDATPPAPASFALPADSAARERVEGMLVALAVPVTATETFNLGRFGELVVSSGGRLYVPTNGTGVTAEENDRRRLVIDDASNVQNPAVIPFAKPGDVIRLGDTLTDVVGVMTYAFGEYRLQPTAPAVVNETNHRPPEPDAVGGDVQVASFNVLNYFTTIDDGDPYPRDLPRGADSVLEFERQRAKIVEAIATLDADVVGLMEIENDEDDAAVDDLVAALNTRMGAGTYAAIEEPVAGGTGPVGGTFGDDAIKVAMIYKPAVVRPLGPALTTTDPAFDNARLPLAQAFKPVASGTVPFTVVVNHFKSKSCATPALLPGDPNADTGQGCYNADRIEQSAAILDLLADVPTNRVLVIGDLNSYGEEDPIDLLERGGLVDLVDSRLAEPDQYSYVFEGEAGYLDHALATPALAGRVTGVDIWHINSDEARFLDYNTEFNPAGYYRSDAYRSSDHDPVLVGLDLSAGNGR